MCSCRQDALPGLLVALGELSIEMIFANSPQSKGRIERLWGTFLRERGDQRFLATVSCYTAYDMSAKRTTRILAVSVPPGTARDFERTARDEGRNKSELFREMLRVYRAYRETRTFESLQRYGAARARRLGIATERDIDRLIAEARRD